MSNNKIIMGRLASPHGVHGWIKVVSFTSPIDGLLDYSDWFIQHQDQWLKMTIETGKVHGNFLAVKLAGIDDRDEVHAYTNDLVAIERGVLPKLKQNEYYWADLVGLRVLTLTGTELGLVESLIETGSNDVLKVIDDNGKERLVPYLSHVVKSIDLPEKVIVVDWDPEF